MVVVEQRSGEGDSAAPWILDRHGQKMQAHDDGRRTRELWRGLTRHGRVRTVPAKADPREVEEIVAQLHDDRYLALLKQIDWEEPTLLPELAPPGLPADSPVWAGVVKEAFEGMRTAVAAAQQIAAGERFAYAVCRPPGHHAGPGWMGGYCYLNTAAAAAQALLQAGVRPVAILDLDFHFPTGTRAMVERMRESAPGSRELTLHSLHASTLEQVPWRQIEPLEHERFVQLEGDPDMDTYLRALGSALDEIAQGSAALVLSLGYDIVGGDPHGTWSLPAEVFAGIGELLAGCGLPVCVVQEGGYAVDALAECGYAFALGLLGENGREPAGGSS
jgi:acetoin utilization deacetylase AcuC-like enzyme